MSTTGIARESYKFRKSILEEVYGSEDESEKVRHKPPHHLLETQIFSYLEKNEILRVNPHQLSFLLNKGPTKKKVKIINASNTRANFHIIAPINTNRWQISYEKPEGGVVPGKHVEITVNFIAPKNDDLVTDNIFQDSIRIHCVGQNLLVPLYAYPTIDANNFPKKINFGSVALGQSAVRSISLKSDSRDIFTYTCQITPPNPVFSITPASGQIEGNTEIQVAFNPTEFVTCSATMTIQFSTFDRKVLRCELNGNCLPGLLTTQKKREFALENKNAPVEEAFVSDQVKESKKTLVDKSIKNEITELHRKKRREMVKASTSDVQSAERLKPRPLKSSPRSLCSKSGAGDPTEHLQIGAIHHINKILNRKEIVPSNLDEHFVKFHTATTEFRARLRKAKETEKNNKLKWQVKIGEDIPEPEEIEEIQNKRDGRKIIIQGRTEREANTKLEYTPVFDLYRNSPWRGRHFALVRFQQAARTVLIRIRAEDRLVCLRKLLYLVNERGMSIRMAEMKLTGSIDETQIYHIASPPSQREYVVNQTSSCTLFDRWKVSGTFRDPIEQDLLQITLSDPPTPIYHSLQTPTYFKLQGYTENATYNWENMIYEINKKSEELKEEKVHTPSDWTHEDIDLNIQSYNILSGKKEKREVAKGGQRLSRWSSVTNVDRSLKS